MAEGVRTRRSLRALSTPKPPCDSVIKCDSLEPAWLCVFSQLFCRHDTDKSQFLLGQRSRGSAGPCELRAPSSHARGIACKSRALSEGEPQRMLQEFLQFSDEVAGSGPRSIGDVFLFFFFLLTRLCRQQRRSVIPRLPRQHHFN